VRHDSEVLTDQQPQQRLAGFEIHSYLVESQHNQFPRFKQHGRPSNPSLRDGGSSCGVGFFDQCSDRLGQILTSFLTVSKTSVHKTFNGMSRSVGAGYLLVWIPTHSVICLFAFPQQALSRLDLRILHRNIVLSGAFIPGPKADMEGSGRIPQWMRPPVRSGPIL
jgi:hypothetical protein